MTQELQPRGATKLWAPEGPGRASGVCGRCQLPLGGRPFCSRDGTLAGGPFVLGERYLVDETIGAGGMSLVFGARHQTLGKPVAVKILRDAAASDADHRRRFLREARLASQLHHENIIDVSDFGCDDRLGAMYLVMERLRGHTLAEELRAGRLPVDRAVRVLTQLCRALGAAHAEQVLHRDLSPSNVFLSQSSGQRDLVKLCDFGLSRLAGGEDRVTATGAFLGTPAYMAPEQMRGDDLQDPRADLYALGVVAYEMLTGARTHEASTSVALITQKLTTDPIPMRARLPGLEIPAALEQIVMRCLARDVAARPANAAEIERVLTDLEGASPGAPLPRELVGQTIGSYRVTGLLGAGGVGSVYLGEHPVIGSKVAIKVLLPEVLAIPGMVDRFVLEARAASQIGSPHIPRYFDFGRLPGGQPYAIMEYLDGETLAQRLERGGPLSVDEVARVIAQVADVLGQAHAAGIVHRDIKPENLFLVAGADGTPLVKVLDFGIAKLATASADGRMTQVGLVVGTPYYAAPEQLLGDEVGPAADVYALGATAFELLCGQPPFGGTLSEIVSAKTTRESPPLDAVRPGMPASVVRTIGAMLARDPAQRLPAMSQVAASLAAWHDRAPRAARSRAGLAVAVIGVAALAIALGLAWRRFATAPSVVVPPPVAAVPIVAPPVAAPPVAPSAAVPAPVRPVPARPAPSRGAGRERDRRPPAGWRDVELDAPARAAAKKPAEPSKRKNDLLIADPFAD